MKEKIANSINFIKQLISTKKSLVLKIAACIIIVVAILVIVSSLKGEKSGNIIGNSYNEGLAVQKGNWIYYIELDDDEAVGICKVKKNGKKIKKVVEGSFKELNIVDNYIYCLEEDDGQYNLIKMKTNGKNKTTLARDVDEDFPITATSKWVYYSKNYDFYRVKTNGTERTKISDKDIEYYQIEGNLIYYIYEKDSSEYIAKMKLNGEDTERIAKTKDDEYFEALFIKGGKVYYILSEEDEDYNYKYSLYKMSKNGKNPKKICNLDENINDINMQKDYIYYTVSENYEDYSIKSIKYNGTDKKTIKKDERITDINAVKNWVIYLTVNGDNDSVLKMINMNGEKEKEL